MLGALGRARWGNGVDLVEEDDGRGEFLRAREDLSERGLGLGDPFGQQSGAIDDFDVCAALAGNGPGQKGLPSTWGAGEDEVKTWPWSPPTIRILRVPVHDLACSPVRGQTRP
jgi:hypothetical protein